MRSAGHIHMQNSVHNICRDLEIISFMQLLAARHCAGDAAIVGLIRQKQNLTFKHYLTILLAGHGVFLLASASTYS